MCYLGCINLGIHHKVVCLLYLMVSIIVCFGYGRMKRKATSDNNSNGQKLVAILRSQRLTNGAKVELYPNGDLYVDHTFKLKIKPGTIELLKSLGISTKKLKQKHAGYIVLGRTGIHRLLTEPTREKDKQEWLSKGWDGPRHNHRCVVIGEAPRNGRSSTSNAGAEPPNGRSYSWH